MGSRSPGIDKAEVGQLAAVVRKARPPEPYKGKGIRYQGEYVRMKAGKAGKRLAKGVGRSQEDGESNSRTRHASDGMLVYGARSRALRSDRGSMCIAATNISMPR